MQDALAKLLTFISVVVIGFLAGVACLNASFGLDDVNLIYAFGTDEGNAVRRVLNNLREGHFNPQGHYNYGYVYESLTIVIVRFLSAFSFHTSPHLVGYIMRLIGIASYCLAIYGVFKISEGIGLNRYLSIYAALGLALVPSFFLWSHIIHPDLLQSALLVLSAYLVVSKHNFLNLLIAGLVCGVAFGTKYAGAFLFPFLFLPYFLKKLSKSNSFFRISMSLSLRFLLVLFMFVAGYVVTNPYVLKVPHGVWNDFSYEMRHVKTGDGIPAPANPLLWLNVIGEDFNVIQLVLIGLGWVMVAFYLFSAVWNNGVRGSFASQYFRNCAFFFLYTFVASLYLFFTVRMRVARFLFHIYPFAFILAGIGLNALYNRINSVLQRYLFIILLMAPLIMQFNATLSGTAWISKKIESPLYSQKTFFENNFPESVKILANPYCYVPSRFNNILYRWVITPAIIEGYKPDVIVLTRSAVGVWAWKKGGTKFKDGVFVRYREGEKTDRAIELFNYLLNSGQWEVVLDDDSGGIVVFVRNHGGKP